MYNQIVHGIRKEQDKKGKRTRQHYHYFKKATTNMTKRQELKESKTKLKKKTMKERRTKHYYIYIYS